MEVNCYLKMVQQMVTSTNHIIPVEFTLRGVPAPLRIIATSSCQIYVKIKKVLPSERGASGTIGVAKGGPRGPGPPQSKCYQW